MVTELMLVLVGGWVGVCRFIYEAVNRFKMLFLSGDHSFLDLLGSSQNFSYVLFLSV